MKCLICEEKSETKSEISIKTKKTNITLINKKVKYEFCNEEINRTYLSKHIERCLIKKLHLNDTKIINNYNTESALRTGKLASHTEGASRDENILNNNIENFINSYNGNIINNYNYNNENTEDALLYNRPLIIDPSIYGKTHWLLNKLHFIRLCDSEKQIKLITRFPEQYENPALFGTELEDV